MQKMILIDWDNLKLEELSLIELLWIKDRSYERYQTAPFEYVIHYIMMGIMIILLLLAYATNVAKPMWFYPLVGICTIFFFVTGRRKQKKTTPQWKEMQEIRKRIDAAITNKSVF